MCTIPDTVLILGLNPLAAPRDIVLYRLPQVIRKLGFVNHAPDSQMADKKVIPTTRVQLVQLS